MAAGSPLPFPADWPEVRVLAPNLGTYLQLLHMVHLAYQQLIRSEQQMLMRCVGRLISRPLSQMVRTLVHTHSSSMQGRSSLVWTMCWAILSLLSLLMRKLGHTRRLFHSEQQIGGKEWVTVVLEPIVVDGTHARTYQLLFHSGSSYLTRGV